MTDRAPGAVAARARHLLPAFLLVFATAGTADRTALPAAPASPADPSPDRPKAIAGWMESGQWQRAESALRSWIDESDNAVARDLLGVVLFRTGRLEQAEEELRKALALDPGKPSASRHLARLYLSRGAETEALPHLRAGAKGGGMERDLVLKLASLETAAGNFSAAAIQYELAAREFSSVRALLALARVRSRLGDSSAALDALERARTLAPSSEEVLSSFGRASLAARAPTPALLAFEPLVRMHPQDPEYVYLLGVARMQVGDMAGARASLESSVALDPRRPLPRIALGLALNDLKRYDEAAEALERALLLEPENLEGRAALAEAVEGRGDVDEAITRARAVLADSPTHPTANLVLGKALLKQERYEEARRALERALESQAPAAKVHYQLSLVLARLGDREASEGHRRLYRQALEEIEGRLQELRRPGPPRDSATSPEGEAPAGGAP